MNDWSDSLKLISQRQPFEEVNFDRYLTNEKCVKKWFEDKDSNTNSDMWRGGFPTPTSNFRTLTGCSFCLSCFQTEQLLAFCVMQGARKYVYIQPISALLQPPISNYFMDPDGHGVHQKVDLVVPITF